MQILGFTKTTLLDYPEHLASIIFLGGCNFRCPFCHNSALVLKDKTLTEITQTDILTILKKRSNVLDGVCISGGEPTLAPDLPDFIKEIKKLGLKVKLDTNGYHPEVIQRLLDDNLIDYIAMDIKASPAKYDLLTGINNINLHTIDESIQIIMNSSIEYEFRTTVVSPLLDSEDFMMIGDWIRGAKHYYLQPFNNSPNVLSPQDFYTPSAETLNMYLNILRPAIPNVQLRGLE